MGLRVENVSKSFGEKKAVDNLSFAVEEPGVYGLIGTNGAGKTTTIRMILGVMDHDEGRITWSGGPLNRHTVRFGYMPEERGIYPKTRVLDQLIYFGRLRGMGAGRRKPPPSGGWSGWRSPNTARCRRRSSPRAISRRFN